ncbi:hypothetical protein N9Q00_00405 [Amylibacter sp.]|nr:hypothetical protein [Amylibacter sp.]MDB9785462.1 hypothetical protein [Amylibacter sp.]
MHDNNLTKVLVVDSPILPYYMYLIGEVPDQVVIDASDGTYTATELSNAVSFFFSDVQDTIIEIDAPSLWIVKSNFLKFLFNLIKFELNLIKLNKNLLSNRAVYYGSRTSSIMLLPRSRNRILIDHGIGEPIERLGQKGYLRQPSYYVKWLLGLGFRYFQRPPKAALIYSCFEKLNNPTKLNVQSFSIRDTVIPVVSLFKNEQLFKDKNVVVVLFGNTPHDGSMVKFKMTQSDMIGNEKLLKRAINLCNKESIIICKFHPTVVNPSECFKSLSNLMGLQSAYTDHIYLWDDCVRLGYRMLPIELLWMQNNVSHVLCEHSAVGFSTREFGSKVEFHLTLFSARDDKILMRRLKLLSEHLNMDICYQ